MMQALINRKIQEYLASCNSEQRLELVRKNVFPRMTESENLILAQALLPRLTAEQKGKLLQALQAETGAGR